jgi:hypothetical protein
MRPLALTEVQWERIYGQLTQRTSYPCFSHMSTRLISAFCTMTELKNIVIRAQNVGAVNACATSENRFQYMSQIAPQSSYSYSPRSRNLKGRRFLSGGEHLHYYP